ncbi:MAG: DUF1501 domain-containing protein [Roseibacillus sp.]|nr:DUF1501 domain-containing protein [Roseibacillus sp.]
MNDQENVTHWLAERTRRHFFRDCGVGLGTIAFNSLLGQLQARHLPAIDPAQPMDARVPPLPARAKNVIFLHMAGAPSQLELFEDKPKLREFHGKTPPKSLMEGKRFAFLKGNETLLGNSRPFARYGQCGMSLSDQIPHHRKIVDEVVCLRGMTTDVFNHGPAKLFMNTGFQAPGRPSMGSWITYGLGSENDSLPGFVVLQSGPRGPRAGNSLWASGFLPTAFQGVPFRGKGDPILHLRSPAGMTRERERRFYDAVGALNRARLDETGDPEILTRLNAYELAYRMQTSVPELMDLKHESQRTLDLYGVRPGESSYAANCLLARRLVERGVRFVQLYHSNWDSHGGPGETLADDFAKVCKSADQASAALVLDLKERGMLDDTLVIWGGEFGRTPMGENRKTTGRAHHIDAFPMWMAGAGLKKGHIHGETAELGFGVVNGKVHVHDLHATLLHLLGFDHERLTYRFQGRDFRLTDVHGRVVKQILA